MWALSLLGGLVVLCSLLLSVIAQQTLGDCEQPGELYVETVDDTAEFTVRTCSQSSSESEWMKIIWNSVIEYNADGLRTQNAVDLADYSGSWVSDEESMSAEYQVSPNSHSSSEIWNDNRNISLILFTEVITDINMSTSSVQWGFKLINWQFINDSDVLLSNFTLFTDNNDDHYHENSTVQCNWNSSSDDINHNDDDHSSYSCVNEFVIQNPNTVTVVLSAEDSSSNTNNINENTMNVSTVIMQSDNNNNGNDDADEFIYSAYINAVNNYNNYSKDDQNTNNMQIIFDSSVYLNDQSQSSSSDDGSHHRRSGITIGDIIGIVAGGLFGFCIFGLLLSVGMQRYKDARLSRAKKTPLIRKQTSMEETQLMFHHIEMH